MTTTLEEMNKALVLEAFDTLFNKRELQSRRAILVRRLCSAQCSHPAGT